MIDNSYINNLGTEGINEVSENLDELSTREIITAINNEDKKVAFAVEKEINNISCLVDDVVKSLRNGGRLIYIGAGTSGRLGVLDASECPPTFGVDSELIQGIIAGGFNALVKSSEGKEDIEEEGRFDLEDITLTSHDIVIGIAASGRTPYVIGALKYANSIGCRTGSIACNKNAKISEYVDNYVEVDIGYEILSGSTRMKSGTAQKLVLNIISTTTMVKLGKVYKGLMVDMRASNEKLKTRAIRMIKQATGADEVLAIEHLENSGWHVKLAIVTILTGLGTGEAIELLNNNQDNIRISLDSFYNN